MSLHILDLPDLVIANGQTDSNVLFAADLPAGSMVTTGNGFRDADSITIHPPDTLPEATVVNVDNSEPVATNFSPLQRGGGDLTLPAGKAVTIELISFKAIKLVAAAVGAERRFKVNKAVWI